MFSFFRRNQKKEPSQNVDNTVGNNIGQKRRPTISDTCPPTAKQQTTPTAITCAENSEHRDAKISHQQFSENVAPDGTTIMAPMAAFRGKGKAKRKTPPQQPPTTPDNTANNKDTVSNNIEKPQQLQQANIQQQSSPNNTINSNVVQKPFRQHQTLAFNNAPSVVKPLRQIYNKQHSDSTTSRQNPMEVEQQPNLTTNPNLQKKTDDNTSTTVQQQKKTEIANQEQSNSMEVDQPKTKTQNVTTNQNFLKKTNDNTSTTYQQQKKSEIVNQNDTLKSQTSQESSQQPKKYSPMPYSQILRRLDQVPSNPPTVEPEKRRHSVKPCSHVTVAASPRVPPPRPATPSPPSGSPVALIRSRAPKEPRTEEANTVTAAIKLKIDMPNEKKNGDVNASDTIKIKSDKDKTVKEVNSSASATVIGVTINGKQNQIDNDKEKRNLVNQETRFQSQIAELNERLRVKDVEANELRTQMESLKYDVYVKSSGFDRLQAELTSAHKESEAIKQKLRHLQDEVNQYKQKNAEMVEELQKKTDEYKTLETSSKERTEQLESTVKDLTEKLSNLESQMSAIREERDRLETRRSELETEREEEKRIVQEALDAAQVENETIKRRWEQDFEKLRTVNTDREQQMFDDFEWKLREVQAACKKRLEEKDKLAEQKIKDAQKDVDVKVKQAEQQMNEVLHLKSYEAEVSQLRGLTTEQQHSLRTMSTRVEQLQSTEETLKDEINRLHGSIELEKQKQESLVRHHEKDVADKERQLQIRLEKQKGEVAVQWEQKLRQECARLTAELEQMHIDEKQLAVELVKVQKDREYESVKEQWEKKVQQQLKEISDLKTTLTKKEEKYQTEIQRLQTNADRDVVELRRELDKAEMAYHEKAEKLLEEHEKELDRLNEEAERRLKELEQNSQMQLSSMRTTLELVKEQGLREADERIQRLQEEHQRAQDELWNRLTDNKESEIERIEQEYKQKFDKLKEQFQIVQKNHQSKETDLLSLIENLKTEMTEKASLIERLQGNVDTLHGGVQVLRQEIVHQDENLTKAKAEAEQKIGELQHALKVERDTLQVEREEHLEEITHIQKQNQNAMEQLQRRCQCLTKLFEEIRARYDKRESRTEDLNLIKDLRSVIAEQERDLAILNEEKRYFQMQLMKQQNGDCDISPESWNTESASKQLPS